MWDRIASIHEASHCLWNYVHQEPIHSVEINKQGSGGGEFKALPNSRVELSDGSDPQQRVREDAPIIGALMDTATRAQWLRCLPGFSASLHAQRRFGAKNALCDSFCQHDDLVVTRVIDLMTPDPDERAAALPAMSRFAWAQAYPSRPITMMDRIWRGVFPNHRWNACVNELAS
jgi:hypothetical protein